MLDEICEHLFELQDKEYRDFHSKLIPNIEYDRIIGVRVPMLRKYAKEIAKNPVLKEAFLSELPHYYYEENNLHMFIVMQEKNFDEAICQIERFLPYIDNWATCDCGVPVTFKNNTDRLISYVYKWIESDKTYTIRYGIGVLMRLYLDDNFKREYADAVAKLRSDEYYVNMMKAWYMATALAKQYDAVLPLLQDKMMDSWSHNKSIQKARESYRITKEQKEYLKTLKI